jgi:HTH-type transcriptional regulator, cell division transcriptional repressor
MRNKSKNIIGPQLAAARKKHRPVLTQLEVAERSRQFGAELDRAAVAKIETGIRGVLDYELVALAKALRVSVQSLLRQTRKPE